MGSSWNQALSGLSTKTTRNNWYQSCRSSAAMTQTLTTRTFTINELNSRIYLDGLCSWCEESYHPSSECKANLWSKIKLTDDTGKFLCYVDFDGAEKSTSGSLVSPTLAIEESIDDGHETLLPNFQQSGQFSSALSLLKSDFNCCDDESCVGNGVEVPMVTGIVGVEMMKPSMYVTGLSLPMAMNELVISLGDDKTMGACDSFNSVVGDYVHYLKIPFSCDLLKINEEKSLGNNRLDCLGVFSSREGVEVRPIDEPPGEEDSFIMRLEEIDVHSGEFVSRGIVLNRSPPGVRQNAKAKNEEALVSCVDWRSIMKACDSTRIGFELVSMDKVFVSDITDIDVSYFVVGDLKIWIGRNTHNSDCWHCFCCVDEDWVCKTNGCDRALHIDDKVLSQAKFMTIALQEMVSKAELYVGAGTVFLRWSAGEFSCNKEKKWAEPSLLSKFEEDEGGTRIVGIAGSVLLDGNKFTGPIPPEIGRLQQFTKMDFSHNKFSGPIAPEISQCKLLTFVDLSRNELSVEIPIELTGMRILNYLNLSRDHLVGNIPSPIATMQSLTSVDFSYNNLSGLVPGTGQFSYFNCTLFLGNPSLCGPYLGPCKDGDANGTHQAHVKGLLPASLKLFLVIGLFVCSIAFAVAAIIKARSLKKASEARAWKLTAFQHLDFTVDDVLDCLKEGNIIGKGSTRIVYKGVMPNGDHVAVERLPAMSRGSSHDHGFNAEIQTLRRIRHQHIVRLLGFYSNHETNLPVSIGNIFEDDARNPAVIVDLVGDNMADCAICGADLFESIAAEIINAMILGGTMAQRCRIEDPSGFILFPLVVDSFDLVISSVGILSIRSTHDSSVKSSIEDPMAILQKGNSVTTVLAVLTFGASTHWLLNTEQAPSAWLNFALCGLVSIITAYVFVWITKYYTDYKHEPVRTLALASSTGHGTNIIAGVSLGLESTAFPVLVISISIVLAFWLGHTSGLVDEAGKPTGGLFGTAVATMEMLSTAAYVLTMDMFGPIADNASGIVEMSQQPKSVREITDILDAVGNTTKATTKGFAIGSATLELNSCRNIIEFEP